MKSEYRKILLLTAFLSVIVSLSAQDYKKEISSTFVRYFRFYIDNQMDSALNYLDEDIFQYCPRDVLMQSYQFVMKNPQISYEVNLPENIVVGDKQQVENKFYALVSYDSQLKFALHPQLLQNETDSAKTVRINHTLAYLRKMPGTKQADYDSSSDMYMTNVSRKIYAVSSDGLSNWKLLILSDRQRLILEKILPYELLESLK